MRDFTRRGFPGLPGLLVALVGCPGEDHPSNQPTFQSDSNEDDDPPGSQPSPTTALPTTSGGASTGGASTTDDPGTSGDPTTTTTIAASTDGPAPGTCGDGVIDPGEQCDEQFKNNSDSGACTSTCQLALCGDSLVWAGEEACDHGADNNSTAFGGCTEACALGPHCGDGVLQPDHEECDATAPPLEGMAPCNRGTCRFNARVAFVLSTKLSGALGGLALADIVCKDAAASQQLDNAASFKAWLSDGVATPQSRLKKAAADPGYPYALRDGKLLADDLADLITNGPKVPLDITEAGMQLPPLQFVWTNIGADGQPFSAVNHCKEWTIDALQASARVGKISPASAAELPAWRSQFLWTSDALNPCHSTAHIYCFED